MRISSSFFDSVIDTENGCLNTLVIEHSRLMYMLISDLVQQIAGASGKIIVSEKDKPCSLQKKVELLDQFIPFDINTKSLISRAISFIEQKALAEEQYETSMQLLSEIEYFLNSLSTDLPCDVSFSKLNVGALVKMAGLELKNDYHNLAEQVLDYMELVRELENDKLFVLVNMRCFVTDKEMEMFAKDILSRHYHVLLIDASSRDQLSCEKRITIDADWCEI